MQENNIHIITRCSRLKNIKTVKDSIFGNSIFKDRVFWHVIFDTSSLIEIPVKTLNLLQEKNITVYYKDIGNHGLKVINDVILDIEKKDDWIYFIDFT